MRLFNITIYRKIPNVHSDMPKTLYIELGKWWEIVITRELAETNDPGKWAEHYGYSKIFKEGFFIRRIKDGNIIPFWYGYAYYDFERDCAAYCPVPINFLVAGARWLRRKWYEFKRIPRRFNGKDESFKRIIRDYINDLSVIQHRGFYETPPDETLYYRAKLDEIMHMLNTRWREFSK